MPKLKNKSSAKKRFSFTATGKVVAASAFRRHNLRKRPQKMKRQSRGAMILKPCDTKIISSCLPV
ncbi:MAG: 50S ribosomal protein L35 [Holosporales bacterium]|nr:50S ribosomal protein L35 [Holosporales bacterium]